MPLHAVTCRYSRDLHLLRLLFLGLLRLPPQPRDRLPGDVVLENLADDHRIFWSQLAQLVDEENVRGAEQRPGEQGACNGVSACATAFDVVCRHAERYVTATLRVM